MTQDTTIAKMDELVRELETLRKTDARSFFAAPGKPRQANGVNFERAKALEGALQGFLRRVQAML